MWNSDYINDLRKDFPILSRQVYGRPLIYFDNAATTQKPKCVVDAITEEYYSVNANVHRGVHYLSQKATELHEAARETVRKFLNAKSADEIVFTRGTTESINLIASSFGKICTADSVSVQPEVIVTVMEHHSNIVPWQLNGFRLKVLSDIPVDLDALEQLFSEHTRLVSITHVSNVLGVVNPIKDIVRVAHKHGVPVLVDAAQSVPHFSVDVQDLDCDFLVFSGHKVYGPTGIGVLYGKREWLEKLPPYQGGGEMIKTVTMEKTTYEELPFKFEAGTPDFIGSHALATAIDYVSELGMDNIRAHETALTQYALEKLFSINEMKVFGKPSDAVISFQVGNIHHLDLGTLLDRLGIAVRTGHHCAQPLMRHLGVEGTTRVSFGLYNTKEEIDVFINGIRQIQKML